ncbi:DUF2247 family protein [Kurthia gibsonii]|uniref:DUF2247 family protein n=1 Tax=Kurthia gibsonii TaxID=33946 RepID=UPI000EADDA6B|nr:DUF2247 family protein [Kurthia gibsonii]RXH51887.1 DUF2247 family protein [Kurthia gibsonii]
MVEKSVYIKVPFAFLESRIELNWLEVYWGLKKKIIAPEFVINKAIKMVETDPNTSDIICSLAFFNKDNLVEIERYLEEIIGSQLINLKEDTKKLNDKWVYILLYYFYEKQNYFSFPLKIDDDTCIFNIFELIDYVLSDFNDNEEGYYIPDVFITFYDYSTKFEILNISEDKMIKMWEESLEAMRNDYL